MAGIGHAQMDQASLDRQIVLRSEYYSGPTCKIAKAYKDYRVEDPILKSRPAWTRRMLEQWLQRHIPSYGVSKVADCVLVFYRRHGWINPAEKGWYAWK